MIVAFPVPVLADQRDLHLSLNTLYLLSPRLCFFIVFKRDLFVYRDDSGLSCEPNNQLNVYTTSETEGEVVHVKLVQAPSNSLLTVQGGSFVVVPCCLFLVSVSVTFHLMNVHIIFSSVWVAEWLPFRKQLLTRLTICSLCILTICNFSYFPF